MKVAGDRVVGASPHLKVCFLNGLAFFVVVVSARGRLAQFRVRFQPGLLVAGEDSLLGHISAGLVLEGGEIQSWAKAKEGSKDSQGFISDPDMGVSFAGVF